MSKYTRFVTNEDIKNIEGVDEVARAYQDEDGQKHITGYAAVYDSESKPLFDVRNQEKFIEKIERGAFSETLNGDTYVCLNHNQDYVFGRTVSGTMRLEEDDIGLKFDVTLPENVTYANDIYNLVARGDLYGCSFYGKFDPQSVSRTPRDEGYPLYTVGRFVNLMDVAIVTRPAYPDTSVNIRYLEDFDEEKGIDAEENTEERAYSEQLETLKEMQAKTFIIKNILEKDELSDDDRTELETVLNDMIEYSEEILNYFNLNVRSYSERFDDEGEDKKKTSKSLREKELEILKLKK